MCRAWHKKLVAYVVAKTSTALAVDELRAQVKAKLPDYMVPTAFVVMDSLPLTPNGKVDKRSLPAPEQTSADRSQNYAPPGTPVEEVLVGIWQELLRVERVGIHDNFFELGGNSLLSIQIIDRLNRAGLNFAPSQFFQHQTVAETWPPG